MNRILALTLITVFLCLIPTGCKTGASTAEISVDEVMPEDFLSRPRFSKPLGRPLGRVLLHWESVRDANGYEIQMSNSDNFVSVSKNWTVRGLNLELPIESGKKIWFRIRAFNGNATSGWSAPLEVNEDSL